MRVTDQQVRRLFRLDRQQRPKGQAAAQAGMDDKTARKYRRLGKLPRGAFPGSAHAGTRRSSVGPTTCDGGGLMGMSAFNCNGMSGDDQCHSTRPS